MVHQCRDSLKNKLDSKPLEDFTESRVAEGMLSISNWSKVTCQACKVQLYCLLTMRKRRGKSGPKSCQKVDSEIIYNFLKQMVRMLRFMVTWYVLVRLTSCKYPSKRYL